MIEVKNLTKLYGEIAAIRNLNFTVNKGEVVGFLGPNGAGKSTTMKIITGYMAPTSGFAFVGGIDVFENPIEVKKKIGYLPETPPVYLDMLVEDYLQYVAELKGVEKAKLKKHVDNAIEKTNLGAVRRRLTGNLSKGFRQRVGIAQALVSDPEVLILDEPTVGLDPKQVAEIRDLIKELRGQHTIVLSTHILQEVEAVCERIIIINKGQIVAKDTLANLSTTKTGTQKIHLRLKKGSKEFANSLSKIQGVAKVDAGNTLQDWILSVNDNDEMVEQIAKEVLSSGWGLMGIMSEREKLEDLFLKVTYGNSSETDLANQSK